MPRQLPWKSSGGGASSTQTIKSSVCKTKTKTTTILDDIDDDFFDDTVFASGSGKDKGKAEVASDSDDSFHEAGTSTPRTTKSKTAGQRERALSSSPPPLRDYAALHDEPMRKGVSKFDLQDDEWMMVEDEFLETAKLFTRHLHIAEYDRLKDIIEAKKREAEVARPIVAGAKHSVDGEMKERARVQENRQKKAIRDVFASQGDSSEDDRASNRAEPGKAPSITVKSPPSTNESQETDSDDLDAPRAPKPKTSSPTAAASANPLPATRPRPAYVQTLTPATESFVKPALPAATASARPRARPSRMTPFDMLDEYTPPTFNTRAPPTTTSRDKQCSQSTSSSHSPSQTSQTTAMRTVKPRRSIDLLDEWGSMEYTGGMSKDVADRIAKRKVERAKEGDNGKEKTRATNADDIPTFLF
ncbi:hypothetical protein E8E12_009865 [Didymella heteroderae]|uniref:Uncharacterized protein n=1 Tax=Didymella heteroderae TaxID=1769908 RepID=A0A9P5C2S9_9PLEO|nr:hypothetical protein E8E12_009865 [Didymella heteroderae]